MKATENEISLSLKLLAEPVRLRMLGLLDRAELSVGELAGSLGLSQSRVSNHLRLLRDADALAERHSGATTFLKLAFEGAAARPLVRIWAALRESLETIPEHQADLVRLESVLGQRGARNGDFFDQVAGRWDTISGDFERGQARHRAVAHLLPGGFTIADLGCGTGYMSGALLGLCEKVICVDRSTPMLDEAGDRLGKAPRGTEVELRPGTLDALPLKDAEVDGVLAGMVLHHLAEPDAAVLEMRRVLKPGGSAVVLELMPHREAWMHEALGDRHLGLEPSDVLAAFARAGFEAVVIDPVDDHYQPRKPDGETVSLPLYIVRGRLAPALT